MNVSCPECRSVFRVDPAKVSSVSLRARCSVCGGIIAVGASAQWGDDFAPGGRAGAISRSSRETPAGARPVPAAPAAPVAPAPSSTVGAPAPRRTPTPAASAPGRAERARTPTPPFASRITPTPGAGTPLAASPETVEPEPAEARGYPDFGAPLPPPPRTLVGPGGVSGHGVTLTPAPDASNAFTAPTTPTPPATPLGGARRPINPFLANDPHQKARRLARALVSDMVAYNPSKREEGLRAGTLKQLFGEEIRKSYEEFVEQVGREFADSTTHFQEALNDVLAGGRRVF